MSIYQVHVFFYAHNYLHFQKCQHGKIPGLHRDQCSGIHNGYVSCSSKNAVMYNMFRL